MRSAMRDKCPNHVRRRRGCPICERISAALAESALAAPTGYAVGDLVEVLDEGLAMLRRLMPNMPPNHHGKVSEIWDDGTILVEFPLSGENHSQAAPYPASMVRKRHNEKLRDHHPR